MKKTVKHKDVSFINRILKNTAFVFISKIFDILIALIATALIARYLGLVEFGYYAFIMAITIFLAPIIDFGFERITAREIARGKDKRSAFLGSAIIARALLSLVVMGGTVTAVWLFDWKDKISIAILVSMLDQIFIALGMLAIATFQAFERMEYQFGLKFIFNILFLVLLYGVIRCDMGFIAVFGARLLADAAQTVIMMIVMLKRFLRPIFIGNIAFLKSLFYEALPLGLFTILMTASFKVDVFVLKYFCNLEQISLFEAAHRIVIQLQLLPMSLIIALFPHFSRKANDSKAELSQSYKKTFKFVFIISLPFPVLFTLLSQPIIGALFGADFLAASKALVILSWTVSFLFLITLHSFVMTSEGRQSLNTVSAGICLIMNFALDMLWIPDYGYIGASYATLVSYAFFFLAMFYFTIRTLGLPDLKKILPKPLLSAAIAGIVTGSVFHGGNWAMIFLACFGMVFFYITVLLILKTFNNDELTIIKSILHLTP